MGISFKELNDILYDTMVVDMMMNLYGCSREKAIWYRDNPVLGPPIPWEIEMRRRLGGHPVGKYRRAND